MVAFHDPAPSLLTTVAELRRNGQQRVFVVATAEAALPPELPWQLLRAGALDVIAWHDPRTTAQAIGDRLACWTAARSDLAERRAADSLEDLIGATRAGLHLLAYKML
jgi:hypothetical protein